MQFIFLGNMITNIDKRFSKSDPLMLPCVVCLVNCIGGRVIDSIRGAGFVDAFYGTFSMSVVIWFTAWVGIKFLINAPNRGCTVVDWFVAVGVLFAALLPWSVISWIFLTLVAIRLIYVSNPDSDTRSAGWVLFTLTIPVVWSKILFNIYSEYILSIDATFVSMVLGGARRSNVVLLENGLGLRIAAACSSIANTSLVLPLWTALRRLNKLEFKLQSFVVPLFGTISMIALNVFRISLIGWFPDYYHVIHDGIGANIFLFLDSLVLILICQIGIANEKSSVYI